MHTRMEMRSMSNSHRNEAASLPYVLRFLLFVAAASLCNAVAATSYARLTPQEITERTDAWLRVRVQSISAKIVQNSVHDPVQELNFSAEVLDSTDNQVPKVANLQFRDVGFTPIEVGNEGFVAVRGRANNSQILDVYDWVLIGPASTVEASTGLVSSALYWQWVCGLRRTADAWGKIADEDLTFWKQNLDSNDTAVATLAVFFFLRLTAPTVEASDLFAVFRRAYERATQSPAEANRLYSVAVTLAMTLRTYNTDDIGAAILDFIEYDGTKLNVLSRKEFQGIILPLLRSIEDPQTLARLPYIYETYCDSSYSVFETIPHAPSPEIDAWLWEIVRDPVAHDVKTELDIAGAWKAMERRKIDGLLPYLRRVAEGSEIPAVASTNESMPLVIRSYATSIIERLEQ